MQSTKNSSRKSLPDFVGKLMRPLPLFPLERVLNLVLKSILKRNPEVFQRMGEHAGAMFLIEFTDLPFFVRLDTNPSKPKIYLHPEKPERKIDATVTGSMLTHFKMLTGELDGDALFFSRDISISGNTETVLALRNAVDSLDLNIVKFAKSIISKERKDDDFFKA